MYLDEAFCWLPNPNPINWNSADNPSTLPPDPWSVPGITPVLRLPGVASCVLALTPVTPNPDKSNWLFWGCSSWLLIPGLFVLLFLVSWEARFAVSGFHTTVPSTGQVGCSWMSHRSMQSLWNYRKKIHKQDTEERHLDCITISCALDFNSLIL